MIVAVVYVDDAIFFSKNAKLVKKRRKLSLWLNGNAEISEMLRSFCTCASQALELVSPLISATTLKRS